MRERVWLFVLLMIGFDLVDPCAAFAEPASPVQERVGVSPRAAQTVGIHGIGFVDNENCVACHPKEAAAWQSSHHALAMQRATAETVLGDFEGARFGRPDAWTQFEKKGEQFSIRVGGEGEAERVYPVAYTYGVHPLQQYLVEFPDGRLQALSVAWDVEKKEWYSLYPDEEIRADDALAWSGRYQTWNAMCAECHSTAFEKNYDKKSDSYASTWAEINVSCQACHGPGARHVEWARVAGNAPHGPNGLVVGFDSSLPAVEVENCAPCHSRRHPVSESDRTGKPLLDDFLPSTLDSGLYQADGQILDEVYVYGSFAQSKMHESGVRCSDCHDPHSLDLVREGDALCTGCHGPNPDPRFPTLSARRYDVPAHHHHPEASPSASCVACHMPTRTYMGVDVRHDHAFQVPRPDLSHQLGVTNVCTGCHTDRTASWAAEQVIDWHGPERTRGPHWASALHAGRIGDPAALDELVLLMQSGAAPDIVRATAVSLAAAYGEASNAALVGRTRDRSPLVRTAAASALARGANPEGLDALKSLLTDPVRSVRQEAGRGLAVVDPDSLGEAVTRQRDLALAEYEAAQEAMADLPSARFNLAVLYAEQGRHDLARAAYQEAIEMDAQFLPAVANLAQLESSLGRPKPAEAVLRAGLEVMPEEGELHYSLGLLLAEQKALEKSAESLRQAALLMPSRARVQYNYGLAEQHLGRTHRAEAAFQTANRLDPSEPAFLRALAILYAQTGQWSDAEAMARKLVERAPHSPGAQTLLRHIQAQAKNHSR